MRSRSQEATRPPGELSFETQPGDPRVPVPSSEATSDGWADWKAKARRLLVGRGGEGARVAVEEAATSLEPFAPRPEVRRRHINAATQ